MCMCVRVRVCAKERAGKQNKVKFVLESTILRPKVSSNSLLKFAKSI